MDRPLKVSFCLLFLFKEKVRPLNLPLVFKLQIVEAHGVPVLDPQVLQLLVHPGRSEERRVGKECL